MRLNPDFNIVRAVPPAPFSHLAYFSDRRTIEALKGADPEVVSYLEASGFRIEAIPASADFEMNPRNLAQQMGDLRHRLAANYERFGLNEADWNGFDLDDFIAKFDHRSQKTYRKDAPNLRSKIVAGLFGFGLVVGSYVLAVAFGIGEGATPLGRDYHPSQDDGVVSLSPKNGDRPMETLVLD